VAKAYNIAGVPNCFIIGKDGLIKAKELRREEITQQLEKLLAAGKGIQFRTGSFQDALQEAEATGKLIFLDGYTSWCAPCKMMNTTVFTDPEVGHFFNEHFINVKFDMEKEFSGSIPSRISRINSPASCPPTTRCTSFPAASSNK